jgi:hypothetical protein
MSSTATSTAPLLYVDCNVPDADMVADWRRGNGGSTRPRVVRRALRRQSAQVANGGDTQVGVRASDS